MKIKALEKGTVYEVTDEVGQALLNRNPEVYEEAPDDAEVTAAKKAPTKRRTAKRKSK